ncbi:ABC transporter ATP-binding protein [Pseudovibrio exalbescens]|uniref:ABC transporter ATP-binding protein n=1 Tax=Pseudovibrio exalbescens TaxID=197461 RepID=UPI0023658599|nr:ABC transporter ATP-binding protein [Pseudovibrio exalbescens]MDD7909854.1 ABC transporter ATP-binding protein [Pseudovibrio exalbescens]
MTQLRLTDLSKEFSDQVAVRAVNLSIEAAEFIVLLGPSGCGKTTTLRMISGLETPSAGAILFDGEDMTSVPVQHRHVGLVSQRFNLFPHMRVYDNVAFGLSVRGIPASKIKAQVHDMLEAVQLSEYADRFPSQLSGGQMQRVAIARTLVTCPKVLLLDEPFASLDTSLRTEMRSFLKQLQRDMGMTTVLVTHDQVEAMDLADRIAVMFDGELAQLGTPQQVYHHPKSERVARFMGHSNIFECTVLAEEKIETPFGPLDASTNGAAAGRSRAMVRYEAIELVEPSDHSSAQCQINRLSGTVEAVEFLGAVTRCAVQVGAHRLVMDQPSTSVLEVGQPVNLQIHRDHIGVLSR